MDLEQEALLAPDFHFSPYPQSIPGPLEFVFLTGATGFLGVHLLAELLHRTEAVIYCLVREDFPGGGLQRIQDSLRFYRLWEDDFNERIVAVAGDLSQPDLGLSRSHFDTLAEKLQAIYHSAAFVNFNRPYSTLKPINVQGVREILQLAAAKVTKPIHFISTTAVFLTPAFPPDSRVTEADAPTAEGLNGGYNQSKWVAEKILVNARARGFPVAIYRPPGILGHSRTGIIENLDDPWCTLLKGCVQLGRFPGLARNVGFVPVDYVSRAIACLSLQRDTLGQAFHLMNSDPPVSWQALFGMVQSLGYGLEEAPYATWREAVKQALADHPGDKLYAHLLLLANSPLFAAKPIFDTTQTRQALSRCGVECPQVNLELIATYFSYFYHTGYLDALPPNAPGA